MIQHPTHIQHDNHEDKAGVWLKDLWYIVASVKANFNIDSNTHDIRFFKWAMDIYRDMTNANVMQNAIRTVHLNVPGGYFGPEGIQMMPPVWPIPGPEQGQPQGGVDCFREIRINLPEDFMDYTKIAIDCGGYLQPLDCNDDMNIAQLPINHCTGDELQTCLERDKLCNCGGEQPQGGWSGYNYWDWGFSPYWKNGQWVGGAYGRSGYRYRGAFRIDWTTKQIVLDRCTHPRNGIVLEYKSNGIGTGNANVQNGTEDALIAGVEWKKLWYEELSKPNREKSKAGLGAAMAAKQEYHKQVKRVNARKMAMTVNEIHNVVLRSIRQSPKR